MKLFLLSVVATTGFPRSSKNQALLALTTVTVAGVWAEADITRHNKLRECLLENLDSLHNRVRLCIGKGARWILLIATQNSSADKKIKINQ